MKRPGTQMNADETQMNAERQGERVMNVRNTIEMIAAYPFIIRVHLRSPFPRSSAFPGLLPA
jgi:hypothetical protein